MAFTKIHFVNKVTEALNIEYKQATFIAETFLESIKVTHIIGEAVTITGFSKWEVKIRKQKQAITPQRGNNNFTCS